jgi:hypothetical protein
MVRMVAGSADLDAEFFARTLFEIFDGRTRLRRRSYTHRTTMYSEKFPVLPSVCPLCGQPNQCAMAQREGDSAPVPCWCTNVVFTAELLQRIPEAARNKACVCQACAVRAADQSIS